MSSCTALREPTPANRIPEAPANDWNAIEAAFENAPEWRLGQSWRAQPEAAFQAGRVRFGWRDDRFVFLATLPDDLVTTRATARNERMWTLGDVFEIFIGARGEPAYIEYHITPNGKILQLRFPDGETFRQPGGLERSMLVDDDTVLRARQIPGGWQAYGEIPAAAVTGKPASMRGQTWELSFSRYDYGQDPKNPVISSTSPHEEAGFHRRHEWRRVTFR